MHTVSNASMIVIILSGLLGTDVVFNVLLWELCSWLMEASGSGLAAFALPLRLCRHMADNVLTPETENHQEILITLSLVLLMLWRRAAELSKQALLTVKTIAV